MPPGVQLREPIVVRWSVGEAGRALVTRTVIHLGKGAQARLLEEQRSSLDGGTRRHADDRQSLWSGTCEVLLDEGATLEVASRAGPRAGHVELHHAPGHDRRGGDAAPGRWPTSAACWCAAGWTTCSSAAPRTVRQAEIGFGGAAQTFDLTSYTHHIGRDTTGDLLSKGIFQDRSRGFFKGLIDIQRTAMGTDSFLGEFAMLLDRKARSVAVPSLEIDQPDVRRASHSSSVGPIDENQLFYLETRGLPRRPGAQVDRPLLPGAGRGAHPAARGAGSAARAARPQVGRRADRPCRLTARAHPRRPCAASTWRPRPTSRRAPC